MMIALKMTAERIADCGLCSRMMFSRSRPGNIATNIAGMIAKYFAMSLAIENVVSEPRVISICLPVSTTSINLVGLLSRSPMLPASFLWAANQPQLVLRRRFGQEVINPRLGGDRRCGEPIIAGHHHGFDAH